ALPDPSTKLRGDLVESLAVGPDIPSVAVLPVRLGANGHLLPVVADEANDDSHSIPEVGGAVANESRLPWCHEKTRTLIADIDRVTRDQHVARSLERCGFRQPVTQIDNARRAR